MTLSVVVAEPLSGLLGVATASRSLGVGSTVPGLRPGVGAVVSQSWTNPALRGRLLADLAAGLPPDAAVAGVAAVDAGHPLRQVAVVAANGDHAVHTGGRCSPWAGSRPVGGALRGVACGNLLVDGQTLRAVVGVLDDARPAGDPLVLARALVAAMTAGLAAGGDRRGQQSAALQVGAGDRQDRAPYDLAVDLRVDDHEQPLAELARLLALTGPPLTPRTA